jgi:hypothetical protein
MSGADVARYPNLTKRGNVFQIRLRVPSDVRALEPKEHIQVSLRTGDHGEAVKRYRLEQAKLERRFADLRATLAAVDKRLEQVHRHWHEADAAYFEPDALRPNPLSECSGGMPMEAE